jgi:hypothetical protein
MPACLVAVGYGPRGHQYLAEVCAAVVGEAGRTQCLERERRVVEQELHRKLPIVDTEPIRIARQYRVVVDTQPFRLANIVQCR